MDGTARPVRRWHPFAISAGAHILLIAALVLWPLLQPLPLPEPAQDVVRIRLSGPPPPPPPPLPRGRALIEPLRRSSRRATVATPPPTAPWVAPDLVEEPTPPGPDSPAGAGSEIGSDRGVPEGMDGGVEGGVVGGVPGGVLGGVVGGTGTGPMPATDYDEPARVLRMIKPDYPDEGFVSKTQGTVLVEALIDAGGHVVRTRIVESIPRLDAAAAACVRQWVFVPARRRGRPVASLVVAAISFRIY